jgi:hypothetical protein
MTVATYTCGVGDGLALGEGLDVLIALAPEVEEDVLAACSSAQVITVRADSAKKTNKTQAFLHPPFSRILHKNGCEPIRQKTRFFPSKKPE